MPYLPRLCCSNSNAKIEDGENRYFLHQDMRKPALFLSISLVSPLSFPPKNSMSASSPQEAMIPMMLRGDSDDRSPTRSSNPPGPAQKNSVPHQEGKPRLRRRCVVRRNRGPRQSPLPPPLQLWLSCGAFPHNPPPRLPKQSHSTGPRKPKQSSLGLSSTDGIEPKASRRAPLAGGSPPTSREGPHWRRWNGLTVCSGRDRRSLCPWPAGSQSLSWVLRTPSRHSRRESTASAGRPPWLRLAAMCWVAGHCWALLGAAGRALGGCWAWAVRARADANSCQFPPIPARGNCKSTAMPVLPSWHQAPWRLGRSDSTG